MEWLSCQIKIEELSKNQIDYLKTSSSKLGLTPIELVENSLDIELEDRKWTHLSNKETRKVFRYVQENSIITDGQKNCLNKIYPNKKLDFYSKFLGRKIPDIETIKYLEFKVLTKIPDRFPLIPLVRPIYVGSNYEYGVQYQELCKNNQMYYIRFYDLMMIDYDNKTLKEVKECLKKSPEYCYRIYRTPNGFHVFIMSISIPYYDKESYNMMMLLDCDPFYILFSYKYGYSIRLSKKKNRENDFIAKYVETIGDRSKIKKSFLKLIELHDQLITKSIAEEV